LAQDERVLVNSHHHQAVDRVGRDLVATAWSSDGLIEALEDSRPDRFAVAVQWHPELGWREDRLSQALFERFIAATKEYAGEDNQSEVESEIVSMMEDDATNVIWTKEKSSGGIS
jgi:gamma-glutamyl-gamma-aminobutyrate hydrolase PuuD